MNNHSERRSSLRRPIHHDAMMKVKDELSLNCIIADFCLDGMFIKFMSESANRLVDLSDIHDKNTTIELTFTGDQGKPYTVSAEIVHDIQGACGLRFLQRYDQAVQSLVNLSANSGVSSEHSLPVKTILNECIQYIHTNFGSLLNDFWPLLEEELRAAALKAKNDQSANTLMALADKIKQGHTNLQSAVMRAIEDPVAAFNLHLEKRKAMSDRLSIVEKDEFEDWLVSRVLVMRCEADYQSLLLPLKLRLDALGVGDKRHHQSVFGPALLVSAFQPTVQSLIVDSATEKLIFRVFEQKVMLLLKGLYEGLNSILVRHNILPKLKVKQSTVSKSTRTKKTTTQAVPESTAEKNTPVASGASQDNQYQHPGMEFGSASSRSYMLPPFSAPTQGSGVATSFSENQQTAQSALSNISNLLRSLRKESESSETKQEPREAYSTEEFDQGLSALQISGASADWEEPSKSLMARVQENLFKSGAEKEIDNNKKAAIDVVDRFFLSMRKNPRISSEAKQYLLKLEVPVLKVLLKDEHFFEDQQSSVRAVMNRIAQLGAKGSKLNPASKDKVSKLVQKVIEEFEDDTTVFDKVLVELDSLMDRQNNLYVKNVERVAAAAEGTLKVEEANLAVTRAINDRIAHKFVPSALVTLINEGWKEYLNLTYIKYGEESEQWSEALSVIDRLIAYGDDPRIPIDIKVILPKIQEGLKLVSGNNAASISVRDALKAFILNAPKGMHLSEKAQQIQLPETEEDLLSRNINKSQELKNWIVKIKNIPLGSWMKFTKQENDISYMRLVWVAKGFSKFVFVNHQGMKVIELGLFKLANYFKEGRIDIDPAYEVPIVNQGLDDMVKDVYDKLAYESSHDMRTGLINKSEFCRQTRVIMKKGKRTSACSLLFIHFRDGSDQELKLSEAFANQVVKTLEELSESDSILGRISETDFVIFNVVNDPVSYKASSQSALIALCQMPQYVEAGLMVSIGESRAHLGFNNPESMIQHACESINVSFPSIKQYAKSVAENKPLLATGNDTQLDDVVIIDEAANAELDAKEFANLKFDIWGQDVLEIRHDKSEKEPSNTLSTIKSTTQLNLFCAIHGDSQTYAPENEECSLQLDEWWVQKLLLIQKTDPQLFENYQKIRVKLSAFAFNKDDLVEKLVLLGHSGELDASKICFDIYDCFQIEDVEFSAMRMSRLKNIGYDFCLDHFGSDRSPFSYLKALPVDIIKIDEAFIAALNENEEADDLAADSIVEIAHYMGKKVLATEVDSAVCLQKMKHLKVDFIQGSTIAEMQKYEF
jgi:EAL domain-containing protein (putative c-di-GMP-specific phosphodiesterase class I)